MWDYGVIGPPHLEAELRRCQLFAPVFLDPNWPVNLAQFQKAWLRYSNSGACASTDSQIHCMNARHAFLQLVMEKVDPQDHTDVILSELWTSQGHKRSSIIVLDCNNYG